MMMARPQKFTARFTALIAWFSKHIVQCAMRCVLSLGLVEVAKYG